MPTSKSPLCNHFMQSPMTFRDIPCTACMNYLKILLLSKSESLFDQQAHFRGYLLSFFQYYFLSIATNCIRLISEFGDIYCFGLSILISFSEAINWHINSLLHIIWRCKKNNILLVQYTKPLSKYETSALYLKFRFL